MTVQVRSFQLVSRWLLKSGLATALFLSVPQTAAASAPPTAAPPIALRSLLRPELLIPELPAVGGGELYLPVDREVYLVLRLGERRVYVYEGDQVRASYRVAIGRPDYPTPVGEFEVFQMIENPVWRNPWTGEVRSAGANSALGLRWIGFTQVEEGIIGFHGTPTVSSIGQAASHGCVRMRNEDVVAMFEQVAIGTRVVVEP